MSYAKFVAALSRSNAAPVHKMRVSPRRWRSTVASTKTHQDKDQLDGCPVVEADLVELISPSKPAASARQSAIQIDFENTEEAYRSKGNVELLRSLLVFKLCTFDVLVDKNKEASFPQSPQLTHSTGVRGKSVAQKSTGCLLNVINENTALLLLHVY